MAKKKPVKKESNSILFEVFCGEAVSIMINRDVEQTEQNETTVKSLKTSLSVQGFLIEVDEDYLYLGYDPEIISQAVKKDAVVHIETMTDDLDDIMMTGAKSDGGMN
jgi:hypothetical protein